VSLTTSIDICGFMRMMTVLADQLGCALLKTMPQTTPNVAWMSREHRAVHAWPVDCVR
jgi:hypothetical protein